MTTSLLWEKTHVKGRGPLECQHYQHLHVSKYITSCGIEPHQKFPVTSLSVPQEAIHMDFGLALHPRGSYHGCYC